MKDLSNFINETMIYHNNYNSSYNPLDEEKWEDKLEKKYSDIIFTEINVREPGDYYSKEEWEEFYESSKRKRTGKRFKDFPKYVVDTYITEFWGDSHGTHLLSIALHEKDEKDFNEWWKNKTNNK